MPVANEGRDEVISCTTLTRIKAATIRPATSNFELNPPRVRGTWMHPSSSVWVDMVKASFLFLMSCGLGENEKSIAILNCLWHSIDN